MRIKTIKTVTLRTKATLKDRELITAFMHFRDGKSCTFRADFQWMCTDQEKQKFHLVGVVLHHNASSHYIIDNNIMLCVLSMIIFGMNYELYFVTFTMHVSHIQCDNMFIFTIP